MLAPVGPAAKRLAGFALLALLAFAASQWPHVSSWAAPVATAADSAVLEVKCVPLSIQSTGATAAGCSAAAGSGTRPQSGYSVEPHSSATADGGSDCQLDCERAGHAHLDVTSLGIQTKESRRFKERLPDNNHAPEAVMEGCFKEQTSYTNHAPEDVVLPNPILHGKPSEASGLAKKYDLAASAAEAIDETDVGAIAHSRSSLEFFALNVADESSTLSFLGKYVEDQEDFPLADMDFGSSPMGTTQDCVLVLAVAALAAVRPPSKA